MKPIMDMTLGKSIAKGQKIRTYSGWRTVLEVTEDGARLKEGVLEFGQTIFGWKAN